MIYLVNVDYGICHNLIECYNYSPIFSLAKELRYHQSSGTLMFEEWVANYIEENFPGYYSECEDFPIRSFDSHRHETEVYLADEKWNPNSEYGRARREIWDAICKDLGIEYCIIEKKNGENSKS